MSAPGWYPDPASPQGGYRYWDGTAWSAQSADDLAGGTPQRNYLWLWFTLSMALIAAIVLFLIFRPGSSLGVTDGDQNSTRPTGTQWNEQQPTKTSAPPEDPGTGEQVACPQNSWQARSAISGDGRLYGGGLSYEALTGSQWNYGATPIPWVYDNNSQTRQIRFGWMSNVILGYLLKSEGFKTPKTAAEQVMSCMATSSLYLGFSGREDFRNEQFQLDGRTGWRISAKIFVSTQGDIKGDEVDIVVLDLGVEDQLSIYISCATIDLRDNLDQVEQAFKSLRVG